MSPFEITLLTPVAMAAPTGASDGGSALRLAGLLKFAEPLTSNLIFDRYAAPTRVAGVACQRTPPFQPHPLSLPEPSASFLRPAAAAERLKCSRLRSRVVELGGRTDEIAGEDHLRGLQAHESRRIVEDGAHVFRSRCPARIGVAESACVLLLECESGAKSMAGS